MNNIPESFLLTRRELQIMKVIWDRESVTVDDVYDALVPRHAIARNTVLTMIRILEHKGALTHKKFSRAFIYEPLLSRQQATRNQVRDIIRRFFDEKPEKLIEMVLQDDIKEREQLEMAKSIIDSKLLPIMMREVKSAQAPMTAP